MTGPHLIENPHRAANLGAENFFDNLTYSEPISSSAGAHNSAVQSACEERSLQADGAARARDRSQAT